MSLIPNDAGDLEHLALKWEAETGQLLSCNTLDVTLLAEWLDLAGGDVGRVERALVEALKQARHDRPSGWKPKGFAPIASRMRKILNRGGRFAR